MLVVRLMSVVVLAITCLTSVNVSAATIGVVYRTGYSTIAPTIVAGAPGFVQTNWNVSAATGGAQGPGAAIPVLIDSTGAATGVALTSFTLSVANSYVYGYTPTTDDETLMRNFADRNPALNFTGLNTFAPDGYSVVVYYGNNEFGAAGATTITVNGISEIVKTAGPFPTTGYVQDLAGPGISVADRSNYAVFTGLTGDTLSFAMASSQNDGFTALQIIPNAAIPEPSTIALAGVALLGGAFYRLRRHSN